MINMIESRLMEHFWRQWEPQIIYVHHQTAPFPARIWLPPFSEPVGLEAPYISVARSEHDRHGHRQGPRRARADRRHAHGHCLRRLVSGLRRLRPHLQEHPGLLDGDGREHGRPARIHGSTTCPRPTATCGRRACTRAPGRPAGGGWRDAVAYDEIGLAGGPGIRGQLQGVAALQPLSGRPRSDRPREESGALTPTSSRRTSAIPSPPSSCSAAWLSAACASLS